jgi:superfamily II DNA/RNA helicase
MTQRCILIDPARRTQLVRHLIAHHGWKRVLMYVATKHAAEVVADKLRKAQLSAEPLHKELSPGKQAQVLADFKSSRVCVMVATDSATEGLALTQKGTFAPVVVNFDLPRSAADYLHRVEHAVAQKPDHPNTSSAPSDDAARLASEQINSGWVINLVTPEREPHFRLIEKRQGIALPRETIAGFELQSPPQPLPLVAPSNPLKPKNPAFASQDTSAPVPTALAQAIGGIKGKRPSKKDKLRQAQAMTLTASGSIASIALEATSTVEVADIPVGDQQTRQNPKN